MKIVDLSGKQFARFRVISRAGSDARGQAMWQCKCACGTVKIVRGGHLKDGNAKSCGCLLRDFNSTTKRKHGAFSSGKPDREYIIWAMMKQRCLNPKTVGYERYGGRGIRICKRWMQYANFIADMGRAPSPAHSLDRFPNKNGDYERENCRWADPIQQARNSVANKLVTFQGETKCLMEWCKQLGIPYPRTWYRLKHGWTPEQALVTEKITKRKGVGGCKGLKFHSRFLATKNIP